MEKRELSNEVIDAESIKEIRVILEDVKEEMDLEIFEKIEEGTAEKIKSHINKLGRSELLNPDNFKCDEDVEFDYYLRTLDIDFEEIYDFEELEEMILFHLEAQRAFDIEIIYYHNAIKYLKENDSSLKSSIEIALCYGYELNDVNSELLASLLASQNARDSFTFYFEDDFESIKECFDLLEGLTND